MAIASYESGHKADRIRRANRQKAERGDWHGGPRFGYGLNGALVPREAAIVREMANRCLAGQSLRSIAQWLNDESGAVPTHAAQGTLGVWHATTVKSILTSARISGQRAYEPGSHNGDSPTGRKILGPGNWPAIITPDETARLRVIIGSPDRRASASSIRLLSSIATCGLCGAGLMSGCNRGAALAQKRRRYLCKKEAGRPDRGGLSIVAEPLEDLISEAIILRLAHTRMPKAQGGTGQSELSAALERVAETRARLEDLSSDYVRGLLTRSEFSSARMAAQGEIVKSEAVIARQSRSTVFSGIPIGSESGMRAAWDRWNIPQRRAILAAIVDTLIVLPRRDSGPIFRPDRVELRFKV
ncbi:recombinase family protein [uncultured Amnibacterium sp.]|uniref:recombinase family protein n=1 Tax=uncultured Amnibacterium sp. TaxID=1631851 RepID=UPI0035CA87B0